MKLHFLTGNKNKVIEAEKRLGPLGFDIIQENLQPPEIQADTLEEVALFSAKWAEPYAKKPFFLEDSGFFVDSLNGFPGVYSAYVFRTLGYMGILRLLEGVEKRCARFVAIIAYHDGEVIRMFRGEVLGTVTREPRGGNGFGYDPIFIPEGSSRTFAEMDTEEKGRFSHRGKALENMERWLKIGYEETERKGLGF